MEKIEELGKELIANLEKSRVFFDKKVKYYQDNYSNPLRTGWCCSLVVHLDSEEKTITTDIYCKLFGNSSERGKANPLEVEVGDILKSQDNRKELVAILQPWLDKTVQSEEYGGFYYDDLEISIYSDTLEYGDKIEVSASDEKRKEKYLANVNEFIEKEEYKTADLSRMHSNLEKLAFTIMTKFYPAIGLKKVEAVFDTMEERLKGDNYFENMLSGAKEALYDKPTMYEDGKRKNDPIFLDLACYICMLHIRNGKDYKSTLQALAKDYNYQKAADIITFGSGEFAKEDVSYKDKKLSCTANDVTRIVDIKFTVFDAEAYSSAINFLIKLVAVGFPQEYQIKSNVAGKEYLPIPGLAKTGTHKFWRSLEKYPETFPLLEKYIQSAIDPFTYYSDAEEDEAVPVGGYAAFVLGLYDIEHYSDVVVDFIEQTDFEHSLTVREFFDKVYAKLSTKNKDRIKKKRYW